VNLSKFHKPSGEKKLTPVTPITVKARVETTSIDAEVSKIIAESRKPSPPSDERKLADMIMSTFSPILGTHPTLTSPKGDRYHPVSRRLTFHNGWDYVLARPKSFTLTDLEQFCLALDGRAIITSGTAPKSGNWIAVKMPDYFGPKQKLHFIMLHFNKDDYGGWIQGDSGISAGKHIHLTIYG
jgi:hypothetical protein